MFIQFVAVTVAVVSEELAAIDFHHAGDRGPCSSLDCACVAMLQSIRQAQHVSQARAGLRATSQRQLQPAELSDVPLSSSA